MKYLLFTLCFLPLLTYADTYPNLAPSTLKLAISPSKQGYLDQLSKCESGGKADITILDTNNKYSYGLFQFQFGTFSNYSKSYGILPDEITDKEILLLIHNSYIQTNLAKMMLDAGLQDKWRNCVKLIGNYPIDS